MALVCRRTVPADPAQINAERPKDKKLSDAEVAEISRVRKERQIACFNWLSDYFICQDPMKLKESVIVLIDSWANDIFGADEKNICGKTFDNWMKTVEAGGINEFKIKTDDSISPELKAQKLAEAEAARAVFVEKQTSYWQGYFNLYNANKTTKQQYPILAEVSPEFPAADAYLIRINETPNIKSKFLNILMTNVNNSDLIDRLDEQLETLINEFDPEEETLRKEEEHYELVKKFEGDNDKVIVEERKRARAKVSAEASLADRLSAVLRVTSPEDKKKYAAARKTALKENFLGKYINAAYTRYVDEKKGSFPNEITLKHASWKGWSGKTTNGQNKDELTKSFTEHMNRCREQDLAAVPTNKVKNNIILGIILAVIGLVCFIISQPVIAVIGLIIGVIFFVMAYKANVDIKATKDKIVALYKDLIEVGIKTIATSLQQWVAILTKVADFQNNAFYQTLDLNQMALEVNKMEAEEAAKVAAAAEAAPVETASEEFSLDSLDNLEAETPTEDAEQMVVAEESKPQVTLNQSAEFLQQFASSFSTSFVLSKPEGYDIEKAKANQDLRALKNK
ncbi:MAG: DUF308 domain-containing protein [Ruminococcaceae bacterium]|nr:DUF308 domain-containing protein [Oscillospiraceae bacterium]